MIRIVLLIGGVLVLFVSAASYFFYEEFFLVWLPAFINAVKALSFKKMLLALVPISKRFFLVEIPKRVLLVFGWIFLSIRSRKKLLEFVARAKLRFRKARKRGAVRLRRIFGERYGLIMMLTAAVVVFVAGLVYFGSYLFFWVGAIRVPATVTRILTMFVWQPVQNAITRTLIFVQLGYLWTRFFGSLSEKGRKKIQSSRYAVLRRVVRRKRLTKRYIRRASRSRVERFKLWRDMMRERIAPEKAGHLSQEE